VHEVQRLEMHRQRTGFQAKMNTVEQIYGKAAAMRLQTEKIILEQQLRLPGLPSSRAGLDTLLGNDEQIEFSDILNGMWGIISLVHCSLWIFMYLSFIQIQMKTQKFNSEFMM